MVTLFLSLTMAYSFRLHTEVLAVLVLQNSMEKAVWSCHPFVSDERLSE